ncbi:hypothetical protein RFN57_03990 [Streptomyces violaceochromogenes]|uniref:Uncharacterized protein n=1 Tax=Streptomyces violaceochromogenes TaxID=67377 RepID=A0ABU6LPL9_9ACTN|nr:hypothetical protein [Streptomyces violaceochromogenes]MEC7051452.1 hypothetical protein [Streptomyces violaceochromogenes]GHC90854.1 hypothetical protein GCM10010309_73130 [Streptomyces violaceochromogenes]
MNDGRVREPGHQLAGQPLQGLLGLQGADHGQRQLAQPRDFREVVLGLFTHRLAVRVAVRALPLTLALRGDIVKDDHRTGAVPHLRRQRGRGPPHRQRAAIGTQQHGAIPADSLTQCDLPQYRPLFGHTGRVAGARVEDRVSVDADQRARLIAEEPLRPRVAGDHQPAFVHGVHACARRFEER